MSAYVADPDAIAPFSMTMWSGRLRPGKSHSVCGQYPGKAAVIDGMVRVAPSG